VVLEQQQSDLVNRGLDGIDLREHIDAVRFLVDHSPDATDLALDAV
jgi:hypothetical protein